MFHLVAAIDQNQGIGKDGKLPWPRLKGDMKFYRELTCSPNLAAIEQRYGLYERSTPQMFSGYPEFAHSLLAADEITPANPGRINAVIMGRRTWESLPNQFRPLPNRKNIVLTRRLSPDFPDQVSTASGLEKALAFCDQKCIPNTFVVGGGEVFEEAIRHPECKHIYLTQIYSDWKCDTFFPEWDSIFENGFQGISVRENTLLYQFRVLRRYVK